MFEDNEDQHHIYSGLEKFKTNELEAIKELLARTNSPNPSIALKNISRQSLQSEVSNDQPPKQTTVDKPTSSCSLLVPKISPRKWRPSPRICVVCDNTHNVSYVYKYCLSLCQNCAKFIRYTLSKNIDSLKCLTGDYSCKVVHVSIQNAKSNPICKGCRLKKSISLGLPINSLLGRVESDQATSKEKLDSNLEVTLDKTNTLNETITSDINNAEDDETGSVILDEPETSTSHETVIISEQELQSCDKAVVAPDFVATSENSLHDNRIKIIHACDMETPADEYGLPLDIYTRFSRWLYSDLDSFQPNSRVIKKSEDEVKPTVEDKIIVFSNEIVNQNVKLLTENLEPDQQLNPVEVMLTPIIILKPSSSLRKLTGPNSADSPKNQIHPSAEVDRLKPRAKLTLKLKTSRTIIDRRPMLKKLKTTTDRTNGRSNSVFPNEVSSTALIAPDEDCDLSEDSDIVEINCDA